MEHLTDDQLLDLVDGLTTTEETREFKSHLADCAACAARHQTFVAINAQLESMPLMSPSVVFTERVLDQWDDVRLAVVPKKAPRAPFLFLLCMVGLVVACFVLLYLFVSPAEVPTHGTVTVLEMLAGNESLWKVLLLINAGLLLWLFNQRILQPFFRQRMAV